MSRRVLVVDDDPDIRKIAQTSLELVEGWQVLTASNGAEALLLAAEQRPEAILLDVMMPEMDGPETFRLLTGQPATEAIPVVLLTARVHPKDSTPFPDLGVAGVIAKPFDPLHLAGQVREILGWST